MNEINDIDPNISQGWMNAMSAQQNDITSFPIKIQQSLGILDPNNLPINNSILHSSVIHTSPQTPHVNINTIYFTIFKKQIFMVYRA